MVANESNNQAMNYIADKIGPLNVCIVCGIATSVLGFAWIGIESSGGIIIFGILYGYVASLFLFDVSIFVLFLNPYCATRH